jgi:hypothetical protein
MDHRHKNKLFIIGSALLLMTLSSCGDTVGQETAFQTSNSLSYQAWDNGCDTGYHQFASITEFCSGLQNRVLNNYCAEAARRKFFTTRGCPGNFVAF